MRISVSVSALFLALSAQALAAEPHNGLGDKDPCVSAAIEDVYQRFPLHQKVTAKFFEWLSSTEGKWQTFENIENRGFDDAYAASVDEVRHAIQTNLTEKDEEDTKTELLDLIVSKNVISLHFNFKNDCTLQTYYVIKNSDGGKCKVKHLNEKLDDFDNG